MVDGTVSARAAADAQVRMLARMLLLFAAVKIVATAVGFLGALAAADGNDADGSRTIFWVPQLLFYLVYLLAARRLLRGEPAAPRVVVSLSWLALAAEALYVVAVFTFGPGREQPAFAIAMELRLLVTGDIWDLIFPILAIRGLRASRPQAQTATP